jgi:8-oxo-dGTP diphosphatase
MTDRKGWDDHVRAGVAAVVRRPDGRLLAMERTGAHAAGTWSFPGGGVDFGEHWRETAERETFEETGLRVLAGDLMHVTNDVFPADRQHWLTLFVGCIYLGGEPRVMEPGKCTQIRWMTEMELTAVPLFPGTAKALPFLTFPATAEVGR